MKISVIVPAYNEERLLPATLACIRSAMGAFDVRGWLSELIVCDNNSTDRTAAVAAACGATVVHEPVNQIARARNTGAAAASGDWLIFVDADSCPSAALFASVADQIVGGRCLAGGSTVRFDVSPWPGHFAVAVWNAISRVTRWAAGSFIFCEAATFRRVGGFNEALYAAEEIDLFRRLKRLARTERRSVVILHGTPLVTSARKMHLYRWHEGLWFMCRTIAGGGRTLRSSKACFAWYDGRR